MTWNTSVPAVANQLTADIPDIQENLDCLGPYGVIWVPAEAMTPTVTNGAEAGSFETGTNDLMFNYFAFDSGATEERVSFNIMMPENWNRGTVKAKFIWTSATGSTAGDTVEWGIGGVAISNNNDMDAAISTTYTESDVLLADNGTKVQITAATVAVTVDGTPALGDIIQFRIHRNTDGTDNMTEDAWLLGVAIQYTISNQIAGW